MDKQADPGLRSQSVFGKKASEKINVPKILIWIAASINIPHRNLIRTFGLFVLSQY